MKLRKILKITSLAIMIAATTFCSSISTSTAFAKDNLSGKMYSKNIETGSEKSYKFPILSRSKDTISDKEDTTTSDQVKANLDENNVTTGSAVKINAIFDGDDRTLVNNTTANPYRCICYIEATFPNGEVMGSTGYVAGDGIVATSGHSIYDKSRGGWAKKATVWAGRNGTYMPYGSDDAHKLFVCDEWKDDKDEDYDFGVIKFSTTKMTDKTGSLYYSTTDKYIDNTLTIAGYPNPNDYHQKMYQASGTLDSYDKNTLSYTIDTQEGESGSPIFCKNSSGHYTVLGVNVCHYDDSNAGVRMRDYIVSLMDEAEDDKE
ncbi:trypsin-like serine peptidase [Clostridium beijerinckii]|uniref:trypsin-like serine peptidase n=1 Tax=Clostridium beijerinckii TaxID=1520 RepID=UPI00080A2C49|nr:trypsin-like serine protease [Clostridium beijerinckii]OCB00383.1 hypothetical protein BGS1_15695 [Clostridium beijerinckii]